MKDNNNWKYVGVGVVKSPLFKTKLRVESWRYDYLVKGMMQTTADIRYYTEGVNSYQTAIEPYQEAYTKDLIWPEVKWTITRELVKKAK